MSLIKSDAALNSTLLDPITNQQIIIEYVSSSTLESVGLQLWNGSFLMADFIINCQSIFKDQVVLEMGAGVGLSSILLCSAGCQTVFVTDYCMQVLTNCKTNLTANKCNNAIIKQFDWHTDPWHQSKGPFGWSVKELQLLATCSIVIASDVIYDNQVTDMLLPRIEELLDQLDITLYLTIDKRSLFTIDQLRTHTPALDYFMQILNETNRQRKTTQKRLIKRHNIDISQLTRHFLLDKDTSTLELWQLTLN